MVDYDLNKATTTDMENQVDDFSVSSYSLDTHDPNNETSYTFTDATEYFGYYKTIPELKKSIDALASWTIGKGYNTDDISDLILEEIRGWGEDSFINVLWNLLVTKKIIGDSFAEIVRDDEGRLLNLKPISPERMRIVVDKKGMIKRYEELTYNKKNVANKFKPNEILHLSNDRIGDEIHGTSVVEACKWIIDARNEAMQDKRIIEHRNKALGIVKYKTDKEGKINYANQQIEKAVNKGEMLGIPDETMDIEEFPNKSTGDSLNWIRYLENFFYQAVGVPRIILGGADEYTEASSKMSHFTFEQVYVSEQKELESDLWNQIGIRLEFNKPVGLKDDVQQGEQRNAGQEGFQPNETQVKPTRSE